MFSSVNFFPFFLYAASAKNWKRCDSKDAETDAICIFLLTFIANNLIYESHCDFQIAKFDV